MLFLLLLRQGKTKSTPSPKTEVWTLDLGLENNCLEQPEQTQKLMNDFGFGLAEPNIYRKYQNLLGCSQDLKP